MAPRNPSTEPGLRWRARLLGCDRWRARLFGTSEPVYRAGATLAGTPFWRFSLRKNVYRAGAMSGLCPGYVGLCPGYVGLCPGYWTNSGRQIAPRARKRGPAFRRNVRGGSPALAWAAPGTFCRFWTPNGSEGAEARAGDPWKCKPRIAGPCLGTLGDFWRPRTGGHNNNNNTIHW